MSLTRAAYYASFAKFVSFVAATLRITEFYVTSFIGWLESFSKFCFSIIENCLGAFGNFRRRVIRTHQGSKNTSDPMIESRISPNETDRYRSPTCFSHETHKHSEKELVTGAHARLGTGCQTYPICMFFEVCIAIW